MIKLSAVTLKNFLSVGNVTQAVKLNEHGLTLVLGSNTDSNGGITRNGAGKSTILQAISYALYGKPLTKIKIPNLVNNINGKAMLVTLEFERDGTKFRIERGKKPDVMKFFVNDEEQKLENDETQGENRHTQEEIDRQIGMSHTMFKHIVALNTFTDPFLKLPVGDQRGIIEELLGVTQISRRAEVLKKLIGKTRESIRDQEAAIKATTEANDRLSNAVRQAETRQRQWTTSHEAKLRSLAEELAEIEEIDFDAELAAFDALDRYMEAERQHTTTVETAKREIALLEREAVALEKEAKRYRDQAAQGASDEIGRLYKDLQRKSALLTRHQDARIKILGEITGLEKDLSNADGSDCVCCGQTLAGTAHLETVKASLNRQIGELTAKADAEWKHVEELVGETDHLQKEIERVAEDAATRETELTAKAEAKAKEAEAVRDKVLGFADEGDRAKSAIAALGQKPKVSFRSRDEVYRTRQAREKIEADIENEMRAANPHTSEIDNLKKAMQEVDYEPINELTALLQHQDFLLKLLSNKDSFIRKKIIDQNLSYLNSRLSQYLDKLGLPHEVVFQSDLTVDITNLGRDFDFEQLSRGEMNRVIMATSWSFRDMWESMNVSCNMLWVDEMLDQGMDSAAVEAGLGILKSMARDRGKNVFLISHREELQARIDRTLLVRKENGFTILEADGVTA